MGFERIYGFLTECDPLILKFVGKAKRRGVHLVQHIELPSHAEYCVRWHQFCDDFFESHA